MQTVVQIIPIVVHHLVDVGRFGDALRLLLCSSTPRADLRDYVVRSAKARAETSRLGSCAKEIMRLLQVQEERIEIGSPDVYINMGIAKEQVKNLDIGCIIDELADHDRIVLQWIRTEKRWVHNNGMYDAFTVSNVCTMDFSFSMKASSAFRGSVDSQQIDYDAISANHCTRFYSRSITSHATWDATHSQVEKRSRRVVPIA